MPDNGDNQGNPWPGLIAAIVLVVLGVWLLVAFQKSSNTLDCIASGRHNCAPVDGP